MQGLSYPNTGTEVRFGNSDAYSCNTLLDSVDSNLNTEIYIGGRTQSNRIFNGGNGCYDSGYNGKYRGYITRFSHTSVVWTKTWDFTSPDYTKSVPFVGMSRCARDSCRVSAATHFLSFSRPFTAPTSVS